MVRQAVILCGGLGSRLGALTADTPKPLLPVEGTPFLDVLLYELARQGVTRVVLLAGFAAERIVEYAASTPLKTRFGLEIEVSIEPRRAGTGGAVWHARDHLDDRSFCSTAIHGSTSTCSSSPAASLTSHRQPA